MSTVPFPPLLSVGSFLQYDAPCIVLCLNPVQATSLQHFLLAHTVTHLTPTPPHTWPILHPLPIHLALTTMKMEAAQSSRTLVSNHHTEQHNN